jgi:pyruvate/2-oxoglutarate dehydrogenase complex dihydrolipoamide dehydrogenase (E3) component
VLEAYEYPEKVDKKVVIVGGGLAGCEAGLFFALAGHQVTVVEMLERVAPDSYPMHRVALMDELERARVELITQTCCLSITKSEVEVEGVEGKRYSLPADTVLYALGMNSLQTEAFKQILGEIPVFTAGDCVAPRKIIEATEEGFNAGMAVL